MSKIPGTETELTLMVNCKTYPAVSKKYVETVCTGGVTAEGDFIRLYPVPFRFLEKEEQYDRWDVIRVRAYRDTKDQRPESWHFQPGTEIERIDKIKSEKQRWEWMRKTVHESAAAMESMGRTNGCVRITPLEFYWKPDRVEWTPSQVEVIQQGDLFTTEDPKRLIAERVPFEFRLKYRENSTSLEFDGKVLAWSLYQGYRRNRAQSNDDETALQSVAKRVRDSIFSTDRAVFAILGTHSRFGHWMISALYHLPTNIVDEDERRGGHLF